MASDVRSVIGRGKELAARLTPVQKIAFGAIVLTAIAGTLVLGRGGSATEMTPLYTNLQSADASAVVDALNAKNVKFTLTDAGHTVLVPTAQVYDLRVALAGAGLPGSSEGYSLLDKQGITTSDYLQKINYQRALEGELDKTLEAMSGVQSAAVHLALPDASVFVDTPANPTASVLLVSSSVGGITADAVDAVVHLVASAVKNLKPADVTVIDSSGAVLSSSGVDGQAVSGASGRTQAVTAFESRMQNALTTLLARITGAGKVAVTVTADLDLNSIQSTSEDYGPLGSDPATYVVTEQNSNEAYGGGVNGSSTGVLGADGATTTATSIPAATSTTTPATTIPGATTTTNVGAATSTTISGSTATTTGAYGSSDVSRTYAIDRVVQQMTTAPGTILQLHVAVLVDDKVVSATQATALESLVTTAAGIDANRGDSVIISRLPFDTSAATEAAALAKAATATDAAAKTNQMIRTVAIAFVILVALLLAYRSARRARRVTATPINIGEIGVGRRVGAPVELPPADTQAMDVIDRHEDTMGELANIADRRPEDVANVLRTWLADAESGKR